MKSRQWKTVRSICYENDGGGWAKQKPPRVQLPIQVDCNVIAKDLKAGTKIPPHHSYPLCQIYPSALDRLSLGSSDDPRRRRQAGPDGQVRVAGRKRCQERHERS